jgi:streptogramin lyase
LWVAVNPTSISSAIDRIGLNGSVTSFAVPREGNTTFNQVASLATDPDGDVWFDADFMKLYASLGAAQASIGAGQVVIGKLTPAGHASVFAPIPVAAGESALASAIVSGPGGDLWFGYILTDSKGQGENFIGRATTAGAVKLLPVSPFSSQSPWLESIAVGADGNLWFTEYLKNRTLLGRMTPSGVVTQFPIGNVDFGSVANGLDGSLILTGQTPKGQHEVFRVATTGAITQYKIPAAMSKAFGTYLGAADGSLWFANESGVPRLGRIAASGAVASYHFSARTPGGFPVDAIAVGEDGNLYALDNGNKSAIVYRILPSRLRLQRPAKLPV